MEAKELLSGQEGARGGGGEGETIVKMHKIDFHLKDIDQKSAAGFEVPHPLHPL